MVLREAQPDDRRRSGRAVMRNIRSALALDDRYLPARTQLALSYLQQAGDDPNSQHDLPRGPRVRAGRAGGAAANADLAPDVRSFTADIYNTWGMVDIRRNEIIKALEHFRRAYSSTRTCSRRG
jgi:hypothetical protein